MGPIYKGELFSDWPINLLESDNFHERGHAHW